MDQTRQKALTFTLLFALSSATWAWDAADCADATLRLRQAADVARDAGGKLAATPSSTALSSVRAAVTEAERFVDRARVACGGRSTIAPTGKGGDDSEQALKQIEDWTTRMEKTDPKYLAIENVLLKHLDYVLKGMPPQYWLPTLQLMYGAASDAAATPQPPARQRF